MHRAILYKIPPEIARTLHGSHYYGRLDKKHIRGINHALAVSIGLIEPVPPKLLTVF